MRATQCGLMVALAGILFLLGCAQTLQIAPENRKVVKMEIPSCV